MSYGKTVNKLRGEYAPYDRMPAFDEGLEDYERGFDRSPRYHGIAGQAYDRGAECAMRMRRS